MTAISSPVNTKENEMSIDLQKNDPISTFGSDNVFIALYYSRKGELIELTAQFVQYFPVTGNYDTEEVGREVTTDEEDAFSYACDLEYAGDKRLRELDIEDQGSKPCDFQTALERAFARESQQFAIAAE
jgi:hypothetical protein